MVRRFSWTVWLNLKTFFVDSKDFVVSASVSVQFFNINKSQLKDAEVKKLSRYLTDDINFCQSVYTAWLRPARYAAVPDIRQTDFQKKPVLKPDSQAARWRHH